MPEDTGLHNSGEPKKELAATEQMRNFLNMGAEDEAVPEDIHIGDIPPDLPFLETLETPVKDPVVIMSEQSNPTPDDPYAPQPHTEKFEKIHHPGPLEQILNPSKEKGNEGFAFVLWAAKTVLPYVVIFAIGLGIYFFWFSDFSINSLFKGNNLTIENVATVNNKDLEKLKSDEKSHYDAWMKQFFFAVNDEAIISMDTDVSGNGLTNFEKYLLNLNPKVYSTRGSNQPDGQLVINGTSPWTGKPFTDKQKELVEKYISKELISNRITAAAITRGVTKFAEYVNPDSPYYVSSPQLENEQTAANTAQLAQQNQNSNSNPATTPNFTPSEDINEAIPAKLVISANNISAPLTWTKAVADFDKDLHNGLVHYPGTALPGQIGTAYISGHSSGYLWDKSAYKTIFAGLGNVKDGTSFTITATRKDGKQIVFHYVVDHRGEFEANDQAQFVSTSESVVALSTCWPVGTTARRLVLFAKLSQTEVL